jgi:hypothetical protein
MVIGVAGLYTLLGFLGVRHWPIVLALIGMFTALLSPGARTGTIAVAGDGPNRFSIDYHGNATDRQRAVIYLPEITAREASRVLSISGAEPADIDGRLALRVSAPSATVRIAYSSPWLTAGLWCTGLGLLVFGYLVVGAAPGLWRRAAREPVPA